MNQMNGTKISGRDDGRFDLLVDGELGEEDRRALLTQLDREPGGWRHCALAFLEAQAWKGDFASLLSPSAETTQRPQPAGRRRWNRHAGTLLAMAASFLVALALGIHWRGGDITTALSHVGPRTNVAGPIIPAGQGRDAMVAASPWQMVTLAAPSGGPGGPQTFQLPAIQTDRLDEAWLRSIPKPVSPELLQALRQSGHAVQQRRELLPVPMNDGRRLVVPVDQVDIHYVGRPKL